MPDCLTAALPQHHLTASLPLCLSTSLPQHLSTSAPPHCLSTTSLPHCLSTTASLPQHHCFISPLPHHHPPTASLPQHHLTASLPLCLFTPLPLYLTAPLPQHHRLSTHCSALTAQHSLLLQVRSGSPGNRNYGLNLWFEKPPASAVKKCSVSEPKRSECILDSATLNESAMSASIVH